MGVFAILLLVVMVYSYVQETVGFTRFYEVVCKTRPGERTGCRPTGRYLVVTRVDREDGVLARMRVEEYSARDYMESSSEYIECTEFGPGTYACREALTAAVIGTPGAASAPWRMVRGRLVNDRAADADKHYLNVVALWRNRLTFGNYDY